MTRRLISSGSTFEEQIGYSRAVVDGEWIFVSGRAVPCPFCVSAVACVLCFFCVSAVACVLCLFCGSSLFLLWPASVEYTQGMLFLGHFSFTYESRLGSRRKQPWHGHFTAVAEARNVDAALEKFAALIDDLAVKNDLLSEVEEIYLDSCIEVTSIPRAGFIGQVNLQEGDSPGGISTTLPRTAEKHAVSYHLEPESEEPDGSYEPWPFVVLKKRRPQGRRKAR